MRVLPKSLKVHTLSHSFLFLNLLIALVGMRLPDLMHFSLLRFVIYFLFFVGSAFGLLSCLKLQAKLTIGLCVFFISVFLHAFIIYFLPSFRTGIAFQNYVLQGPFSSNFAISQTRFYMMYITLFIFPVLSLYFEAFVSKNKYLYAKILLYIFVSSIVINNAVALIQGLWDINFLANGSGTAVEAGRAPGLFADSGESSVIYCLLSALVLIYLSKIKNIFESYKLMFFIVILSSLIAGILVNSRIYYMVLISVSFLFLSINFFKLIKKEFIISKFLVIKRDKLIRFLVICFVPLTIVVVASRFDKFEKLKIIHSYFLSIFYTQGNFFSKYDLIDKVRSDHLRVMWASIKDHFLTGTGLGSFQENLFYYVPRISSIKQLYIDLPTNLYLSLISELGLVGLFLVLFALTCLIWKIKFYFENKKFISQQDQVVFFLTNFLPLIFAVPLLICFFVGYNVIFPSVAILSIFILVSNENRFVKLTTLFTYIASFYLLLVSVYFLMHIPRVPAFRWAENDHPQIPLGVGELPQPQGKQHQKKIYFAELYQKFIKPSVLEFNEKLINGQWMKFNNELLFFKFENQIFIPHYKNFPREITLSYLDTKGDKVVEEKKVVKNSGWMKFTIPANPSLQGCYLNISMNHFCTYMVKIDKNLFSRDVFYIEDKNLFGKQEVKQPQ